MLAALDLYPASGPSRTIGKNEAAVRLALLGSGTVGQAVLRRLHEWQAMGWGGPLQLVYAANTRLAVQDPNGLCPHMVRQRLVQASPKPALAPNRCILGALGNDGIRILIDATADAGVAERHPQLLKAGVHVATACKLATGTSLALWRSLHEACAEVGSGFGDRATVGAGLPLLRSIRELRAGGDRIHAIAGAMSGSLAWLFDRFDGSRPFSDLVRKARELGFTEPDPREDLSGEDVRRKILTLVRAAGFAMESGDVEVKSLVPASLRSVPVKQLDTALTSLDAPLAALHARASEKGKMLRFVARFQHNRARVGVEALAPLDPLIGGSGTDNRVAIWSDRYSVQPLIIQGPGAGPEVTAAALLDDVLALRAAALAQKSN